MWEWQDCPNRVSWENHDNKGALERSKHPRGKGIVVPMANLTPIWFERPIMPAFRSGIDQGIAQLGPTETDEYAGLDEAVGAVASVAYYNDTLFDHAPRLLAVGRTGIGYDRVDLDAATRRGIAVINVPSGPTISTAEQAIALMLSAAKNIKKSEHSHQQGLDNLYARHEAVELDGKTLGLAGYGRIARRVAVVAAAFGMRVIAHDPFVTDFGVATPVDLETLYAESHIISVHIPLTSETEDMFSDAVFAKMRQGVIFVNTARGGLVDLDALERALDSGQVFTAGLDVTNPEPLPTGHRLLDRTDLVITPHVAAGTPEAKHRNFFGALEQVVDAVMGRKPPHLVNPDVWPAVLARLT